MWQQQETRQLKQHELVTWLSKVKSDIGSLCVRCLAEDVAAATEMAAAPRAGDMAQQGKDWYSELVYVVPHLVFPGLAEDVAAREKAAEAA
jgi:hypothetical protein